MGRRVAEVQEERVGMGERGREEQGAEYWAFKPQPSDFGSVVKQKEDEKITKFQFKKKKNPSMALKAFLESTEEGRVSRTLVREEGRVERNLARGRQGGQCPFCSRWGIYSFKH